MLLTLKETAIRFGISRCLPYQRRDTARGLLRIREPLGTFELHVESGRKFGWFHLSIGVSITEDAHVGRDGAVHAWFMEYRKISAFVRWQWDKGLLNVVETSWTSSV